MVTKGTSASPGKVLLLHPKQLSELKNAPYEKFLIKFSADSCPPCRQLQAYIEQTTFTPKKDTAIFVVEIDKPSELISGLGHHFRFNSIPYCVITNNSLKLIDSLTGFDRDAFNEMFKKHFCQ